jgi:membrane-associated phospholipid phosphatase
VEPRIAVRRERPDRGHLSFPSGHASTTFATATVLARHVDWRVSVPTLLVATYVASSRVHQHQHYLSDVVFGAALGVTAGRSITSPQSAVTWIPVITPTHVALMLAYGN